MNVVVLLIVVWLAGGSLPRVYAYPTTSLDECYARAAAAQQELASPSVLYQSIGCIELDPMKEENANAVYR